MRDNNKGRVKNLKGFTLIEIVLVIALVGIMATLLISLVNPVQQFKKSNDAKRKADLHQLQAALELYRSDSGHYPTNSDYPTTLPCGSALTSTGGAIIYLQKIPCDPKNTGQFQYYYTYTASNDTYTLIACLENLSDPQLDKLPALNPSGGNYCDGSTGKSYTVTNP